MHVGRSDLIDCLRLEGLHRFWSRQLQRWWFVCAADADDICIGIVHAHVIAHVAVDIHIHITVTMLNKVFKS